MDTDIADTVSIDHVVFQVRFPRGWIVVDAAEDRDFEPNNPTWSDSVYGRIQELLRDARLVVVTHEHSDHVAGVLRSPFRAKIQPHTLLTRAQVQTLMGRTNDPRIKIDSTGAARLVVLDYDPLMPIGPAPDSSSLPGASAVVTFHANSAGMFIIFTRCL